MSYSGTRVLLLLDVAPRRHGPAPCNMAARYLLLALGVELRPRLIRVFSLLQW